MIKINIIRRVLLWGTVILTMLIFIAALNSGAYLKKPLHPGEDVMAYLAELEANIKANDWQEAEQNYASLVPAWQSIKIRIAFSSEQDQIQHFDDRLEQLGASISIKDQVTSVRDIAVLKKHFHSFK
ncbi:DUF4363 family protein [Desulforamulus aquiferis]|uniref:DUF4363 family protein n=1 Tax=Desulforamulus aquiferis TaxID=1397668 RepID=A0AAW7ZHE1_9FIRM|nr:DUF4363 family protein [Desulforamulus aquiferis]MDO7788707.1 DUF4363 family protein [Desulforamulus aquiferis]